MYGEVDEIKLGKTLFPNWRHILSKTNNNITVKRSLSYCGRDHSSINSAFVY